jgi:drug/metabolite transporter (DMT)-like permease
MTLLFWRGIFSGTAVFLLYVALEGRTGLTVFRRISWPMIAVAVLCAASIVAGVGALRFGEVADAMVIYATAPFWAAGLGYLFIGERPRGSTTLATCMALLGVGIMLWGANFGGAPIGIGLALLMTLSMASFTVIMRRHREVSMLPAMALSAYLCAFFCFWFAAPFNVSAQDFALIAMFGVLQNAAGLALYTLSSKRIPAAEATLMASLEAPFTPFWVWLFLGETPAFATLAGGAVVMTALFAHMLNEIRRTRPVPRPAS